MDEQRTSQWFADRWGKATGSRFADIMATGRNGQPLASRKNYLAELVIERLTVPPEEDTGYKSEAMQWGIDQEPTARLAYELTTGNEVEEAYFVKHETLEAGASPDGYIGKDGLIEIKCPNSATHLETLKTQDVPKQYYAQIQGQLWVTGRDWCDYTSFDPRFPDNAQLFIKRVARNETYIKELEAEVIDFLDEVEAEVKLVKEYTL
jgi:putative phage-type endonuclease